MFINQLGNSMEGLVNYTNIISKGNGLEEVTNRLRKHKPTSYQRLVDSRGNVARSVSFDQRPRRYYRQTTCLGILAEPSLPKPVDIADVTYFNLAKNNSTV